MKAKSIMFPQAHELRRLLGLNVGKLPTYERVFELGGLKFRLESQVEAWRQKEYAGIPGRPHRLCVECNVCGAYLSAGRFNQHQGIHPRDSLSELSKAYLDWCNIPGTSRVRAWPFTYEQIYAPKVYTTPGMDEPVDSELYLKAKAENKVGDEVTHHAGAPGTGYVTWRITRIDDTGVWGFQVENTVRELEPSEVE